MVSRARRIGVIAALWCIGMFAVSVVAQTPQPPPAPQTPIELPKGLAPSDSAAVPSGAEPTRPPAPEQRLPDGTLGVPPLARVTDTAGVLSSAARAQLEAKLAAFEQARGAQIAVIVLPSTQPEPISDYANRIGGAWKIGRPEIGDGVLMVVAIKDRRAYISVARALEGAIPDVVAARITRELMGPQFAKGDYAAGMNAGVDAVMRRIEGEGLPSPAGIPRERVDAGESVLSLLIPIILIGAFVSAMLRRRMGVPGAALGGVGSGAVAGFILSSLLLGGVAAIAVFLFSAFGGFGGGRGGRALGGRGGPIFLPGGWSGGGGGWSGGGGGWSSGGGGDFSGGGGGSSW
ncbi:MAG TPA: TPM domain-containing protein [Burkholderiaceae bacterium]|nr:TPM domain-containing protein [Burkholderiaceae bacterium]